MIELYKRILALESKIATLECMSKYRVLKYPIESCDWRVDNYYYVPLLEVIQHILIKLGLKITYHTGVPETVTFDKVKP